MYLSSFLYNYYKYPLSNIATVSLPLDHHRQYPKGKPCNKYIEQTAKLIQHYNYFLDLICAEYSLRKSMQHLREQIA